MFWLSFQCYPFLLHLSLLFDNVKGGEGCGTLCLYISCLKFLRYSSTKMNKFKGFQPSHTKGELCILGGEALSGNYNASSKIVCHHQKGGECKIKLLKCTFVLMKTNHDWQRRKRLLIKLKAYVDKVFGSST